MYAVVGCSDCQALWVIEGRPDTSTCPRCGTRRKFAKRRQFVTTEDRDHAREVRAQMLAARQGESDAFAELDDFATLGDQAEEDVVDDEEYLTGSGLDADRVAAAGDRATASGGSTGREERVREALRELAEPTEDDVVAYVAEHGVSGEYAREALSKLARRGEVSESRGVYRLL